MAKATLSVDGQLRFDIRVTHRAGIRELTHTLCHAYREYFSGDDDGTVPPLPNLSRSAILGTARNVWLTRGEETMEGWADYLSEEDTDKISEWAEGQVRLAFPELISTKSEG